MRKAQARYESARERVYTPLATKTPCTSRYATAKAYRNQPHPFRGSGRSLHFLLLQQQLSWCRLGLTPSLVAAKA